MPSEAEFLTAQADAARARLQHDARALRDDLLAPLDLRTFVRNRPWWSVGGAAVSGFLCGIVGRRRQGQVKPERPSAPGQVPGLVAMVTQRIRRVLGSALGAVILAQFRPTATPAEPASSSNDEAA